MVNLICLHSGSSITAPMTLPLPGPGLSGPMAASMLTFSKTYSETTSSSNSSCSRMYVLLASLEVSAATSDEKRRAINRRTKEMIQTLELIFGFGDICLRDIDK
ncbi:hypothetical protein ACFE04_019004 [Oxalis oulophora]